MIWLWIILYVLPVPFLFVAAKKQGQLKDIDGIGMAIFMLVVALILATPVLIYCVFMFGARDGYERWVAGEISNKKTATLSFEQQLRRDNKDLTERLENSHREIRQLYVKVGDLKKELEQFREDDPVAKMKREIGL